MDVQIMRMRQLAVKLESTDRERRNTLKSTCVASSNTSNIESVEFFFFVFE
jgi:hypothetical protein